MGIMDNNGVGKLTEASLKRKERLQKLREQAQNKGGDSSELNEKLPKSVILKDFMRIFYKTIQSTLQTRFSELQTTE